MRYQTGHAEVLAEGFGQTVDFGIANSAKAFKGLIDGIYSRKIEAPMRELATNAFDGHKAAGYVGPFDMHLPTALQPTFWIRDYGTGMSHDFMMKRFCIMFDSTKDGLNPEDAGITPDDQVGCLGLGRMSFFAYTDACTLTSWQDGMARMYSVFMGPNGKPQTAFAGEAASDAPNGVKVEFAAKKKDFNAFRAAAIRIFKGFPIQPKGLPTDVREALAVEPLEMGSFWKSYPKDYLPEGGFYARQGCVLYPIDLVQIDDNAIEADDEDEDSEVTLSERFARFKDLSLTIVMDFPIGSLEFDLSRERLAYTDHTLRSLRSRWEQFTSDLDVVIKDSFADKRSAWDRAIVAGRDSLRNLGPLFSQNSFFLEAKTLADTLHNGFPKRRSERTRDHFFFSAIKAHVSLHAIQPIYQRQYTDLSKTPNPGEIVLFFRDDKAGRYINMRIGQHLNKVGAKWGYLFAPRTLTPAVYKKLGCPPIVRVSEIDELPRAEREKADATGGGGYGGAFDRTKVIANGGYRAPNEDEDVSDHMWGFLHRGFHVTLDHETGETTPADMDVSDVMIINTLAQALGREPISFINCRSNDKPGRFAGLPTFYDFYDTMADLFTIPMLSRFVTLWNDKQFGYSLYRRVYGNLTKGEKAIRDDLFHLVARYNHELSPETRTPIDGELLLIGYNAGLTKLRNDLLRRAGDLGWDVLPPLDGTDKTTVKLLSRKWEKAVRYLQFLTSHQSSDEGKKAQIHARTLIRKNAQC